MDGPIVPTPRTPVECAHVPLSWQTLYVAQRRAYVEPQVKARPEVLRPVATLAYPFVYKPEAPSQDHGVDPVHKPLEHDRPVTEKPV